MTPISPGSQHDDWHMDSVPDLLAAVPAADCVVVITNHSSYDYHAIYQAATLIVDTRNAFGIHERGTGESWSCSECPNTLSPAWPASLPARSPRCCWLMATA